MKKDILLLPLILDVDSKYHLREVLLFETEILWGPENKEHLGLRESWDTLSQCLGRWP
jgi:hypothetical protein